MWSAAKSGADAAPSLRTVLIALRPAILGIAAFSGVINLLALTGSLFMLQVYDRVLPSQSVPTLIALGLIAGGLFIVQGGLDIIRSRLLVRVASRVDEALGRICYRAVLQLPLRRSQEGDGLQPLRDLDTVRNFLSGPGPTAILDLPWLPVYLVFVYMLHPLLGVLATGGVLLLLSLTFLTNAMSRRASDESVGQAQLRQALAVEGHRNAEVLHGMGFAYRIVERWRCVSDDHLHAQQNASDIAGGFGAVARAFRVFLQSAILGFGAYLVIGGELSAGAIIAGSIAAARAFAPIDVAIAHWKSMLGARQSATRLEALLQSPIAAIPSKPLPLPSPVRELTVEALAAAAPGLAKPIIQNVSFKLEAGQGLGIIGPSAAGKSTLLRSLIGIWPAKHGTVRLDNATLDQWAPADLGRHIGYLPQDVELFDGTIAENIARFDDGAKPEAIIAAARAADVHDMILQLPDGYETHIGQGGACLSNGQRQRVGLARAFFGDPFLILLDEPSAHLDAEGEEALNHAIRGAKARGAIVIVVTHRPNAIAALDLLGVMQAGRLKYFGPKAEVLRQPITPPRPEQPSAEPFTPAMAKRAVS